MGGICSTQVSPIRSIHYKFVDIQRAFGGRVVDMWLVSIVFLVCLGHKGVGSNIEFGLVREYTRRFTIILVSFDMDGWDFSTNSVKGLDYLHLNIVICFEIFKWTSGC